MFKSCDLSKISYIITDSTVHPPLILSKLKQLLFYPVLLSHSVQSRVHTGPEATKNTACPPTYSLVKDYFLYITQSSKFNLVISESTVFVQISC